MFIMVYEIMLTFDLCKPRGIRMLDFKFPIIDLAKELNKTHQAVHKFCNEHGINIISGKGRSFLSPQAMREYLQSFGFKYPEQITAFQACKGGVGKTSLCYNIASRAVQYGSKVLAIDMDMQAHLTMALLNDHKPNFSVWQDILTGEPIEKTIIEIHPHLHLIPSHLDNSYLDKTISQSHKIIYTSYVKEHIKKIRDNYDLVFIDCAPALSHINTAVSIAADKIFIPVNPDIFSFDGLEKTLSELQEVQSSFQKEMDVMIILNRFDGREKNSLDVIANLKNKYGKLLCQTIVVVSSEIKNAIAKGELLFNLKKKPQVAGDLDAIVKEILHLEELSNAKAI
jgi:chromosome partitioning protein